MTSKELVLLWHRSQTGHINDCKKAQFEFSEIMWKLYDKICAFKNIEEI